MESATYNGTAKEQWPWSVRVTDAGRYTFILRERPEVAGFPLSATRARLYIEDMVDETKASSEGSDGSSF
jgi:uncharacterized protein YqiB (DUF1249 family)